jgi:hypothetical protein
LPSLTLTINIYKTSSDVAAEGESPYNKSSEDYLGNKTKVRNAESGNALQKDEYL